MLVRVARASVAPTGMRACVPGPRLCDARVCVRAAREPRWAAWRLAPARPVLRPRSAVCAQGWGPA